MSLLSHAKNEEMREKLILKAKSADVIGKLREDPYNEDLWYQYAMAISDEQGPEAGIDAFSEGLYYNPFSAILHFGRGRKNIGLLRFWRCIADQTEAVRHNPEVWNYWYYRAVAENLNGNAKEAIADFTRCFEMVDPEEQYPMVDWLFLCRLDLGDKEGAKRALELLDHTVIPPVMDYAYRRRVMLYKGVITPEELMDLEHIKSHCLKLPNRVQQEIQTLTFGLYAYYDYIGDSKKADETLLKITGYTPSAAFGYLKGVQLAKKRGLIQ